MPTGAKAVGAITFALLGFVTATLLLPHLPENDRGQGVAQISAGLGVMVGWMVMGRSVGGDYKAAARAGIYTSVWLLLWGVLIFSLRLMLVRSFQKWYSSATEAATGVISIAIRYFQISMTVEVVGALLIGGMIAGIVTEFSNRHWS